MSDVKTIVRELLADGDLSRLTLDRDILGEVRLRGHRLSVSCVLSAMIIERGDFAAILHENYGETWNLTNAQITECVRFASNFLTEVFCDDDLFSDADLEEFPRIEENQGNRP
jgi:uncharacterized protein (DUF433 family)